MKALLIDAYDSFIYIIYQYVLTLDVDALVVRNDQISVAQIEALRPDMILLGPGPGHPSEAHYVEIIQRFQGIVPILGVCLGHQAIGLAYGAKVARAGHLMHGKTSMIQHDERGCFVGQPNPFRATRYHSLIVEEGGMPSCLEVTARAGDDNYVMGMRHKTLPIESVQFHPESVYTDQGIRLIRNFIATYVEQPSGNDRAAGIAVRGTG